MPTPRFWSGLTRYSNGAMAGTPLPRVLHRCTYTTASPLAGVTPMVRNQTVFRRPCDFWGLGRIEGTVTIEGIPAARSVRVFDARTGLLVASVWSTKTGQYRIDFLDPTRDYVVLAHDYTHQFNAVIADFVKPEVTSYP